MTISLLIENYLSSLKQREAAKSTPVLLRSLLLFGFWAPSAFVHICFHPPQTPLRRSTENLQFMSGHPARLEAAKYQHHVLWEKLSYLSLLPSTAMMLDERLCSGNLYFHPAGRRRFGSENGRLWWDLHISQWPKLFDCYSYLSGYHVSDFFFFTVFL